LYKIDINKAKLQKLTTVTYQYWHRLEHTKIYLWCIKIK